MYGDTFLPNPGSYDELYYELLRQHSVFDALNETGLKYLEKGNLMILHSSYLVFWDLAILLLTANVLINKISGLFILDVVTMLGYLIIGGHNPSTYLIMTNLFITMISRQYPQRSLQGITV